MNDYHWNERKGVVEELKRRADIEAGRIDPNNPYGTSSLFAPLLGFLFPLIFSLFVWVLKAALFIVLGVLFGIPKLVLGLFLGKRK